MATQHDNPKCTGVPDDKGRVVPVCKECYENVVDIGWNSGKKAAYEDMAELLIQEAKKYFDPYNLAGNEQEALEIWRSGRKVLDLVEVTKTKLTRLVK